MTRRIIQFGTSRFLQAHVDLFVHEARCSGQDIGPITVAGAETRSAGQHYASVINRLREDLNRKHPTLRAMSGRRSGRRETDGDLA